MRSWVAVSTMVALLVGTLHGGRRAGAQALDEPRAGGGAPVAVFVVSAEARLPASKRATLLAAMEAALGEDGRLHIIDQDRALIARAGQVPTEVISEARGLLRSGEALLRKERVEQALPRLEVAATQLEQLLTFVSKSELARAQFLLGAALALRGDADRAQQTFERLLTWRAGFAADTNIAPGAVLPIFEAARAQVERRAGGSLAITSQPEGAMAYVDGRFVGFTPTFAEGLAEGRHYVTLARRGHGRLVVPGEVSSKRQRTVRATLVETPSWHRLEELVEELGAGLGQPRAPAGAAELGTMLGVRHLIVVQVPPAGIEDGQFSGFVYEVPSRRELAQASVPAGGRPPEDLFAALGRELYDRIELDPQPTVSLSRGGDERTPVYRRWWFWTGAAAVAAAVALPLLLRDRGEGPACPAGSVCGDVVLEW